MLFGAAATVLFLAVAHPLNLLKSTFRIKKVPNSHQYSKLCNEYWKENAALVYLALRFLFKADYVLVKRGGTA